MLPLILSIFSLYVLPVVLAILFIITPKIYIKNWILFLFTLFLSIVSAFLYYLDFESLSKNKISFGCVPLESFVDFFLVYFVRISSVILIFFIVPWIVRNQIRDWKEKKFLRKFVEIIIIIVIAYIGLHMAITFCLPDIFIYLFEIFIFLLIAFIFGIMRKQ